MNFPTYLVGGAVRDELMGIPCKDLDFVVVAPSFEAMRAMLVAQNCKIFVEKPEYLTIRVKHPTLGCVDFAVARADGHYSDGRHPDRTSVAESIIQDLARRDFTCNAIAKHVESGKLVDPCNGQLDIANRRLVAVGSARARIAEDKLRAFRALRFTVTKGFVLDHEISNAIGAMTPNMFDKVSTERIREELYKMFRANPMRSFSLLREPCHSVLWDVICDRDIWFKPTTEQ